MQLNGFKFYLLNAGISKQSMNGYLNKVKRLQCWLKEQDIEMTITEYRHIMDYIAYLKDKGLQQSSIAHELHAINHYFRFMQQQGLVTDNPVPFIKVQGIAKQVLHNIMNKEQLQQIYVGYRQQHGDELSNAKENEVLQPQDLRYSRNKVMLGFMVFQGMNITDIELLEVKDLKLAEGKVYIPQSRLHADRYLQLESAQIISLMEYLHTTRKELINRSGKHTTKLIVNAGGSMKLSNALKESMEQVRVNNDYVTNAKQIRASVIVNWLKQYGLRRTQYMAGHKHISATEAYKVYITEQLAEHIERFHPLNSSK